MPKPDAPPQLQLPTRRVKSPAQRATQVMGEQAWSICQLTADLDALKTELDDVTKQRDILLKEKEVFAAEVASLKAKLNPPPEVGAPAPPPPPRDQDSGVH